MRRRDWSRVSARSALLVGLTLGLACGDDTSPSDAGSSTGQVEPPDTSTTAVDSTTAASDDPSASTGDVSSDGGSSGGTTGPGSESGESGESSGSTGPAAEGSSTGEPGNVVYSAIALPGGLDRIRIHKADLDEDRCTWVTLVSPSGAGGEYPGVSTPAGWSVESVSINDSAASCSTDNPAMSGAEAATGGMGTIGFGPVGGTGIYPCTVDIDAMFDFAGMLPSIPPTDSMVTTEIDVMGC